VVSCDDLYFTHAKRFSHGFQAFKLCPSGYSVPIENKETWLRHPMMNDNDNDSKALREKERERRIGMPLRVFFFNLYIYQRLHMEHVNGTTLNHRHQSLTPHSNYNNKRCHVHVPITKGVTGIQKNTHTLNSDLFTTKKTRKKTGTHTDPSFKRNK